MPAQDESARRDAAMRDAIARMRTPSDLAAEAFLKRAIAEAPKPFGAPPCHVTTVAFDLSAADEAINVAGYYTRRDGVVHLSKTFRNDLRTFVSPAYERLSSEERQTFIERFAEELQTLHHELVHSMIPNELVDREDRLFGATSDITGIREAITEVSSRRMFDGWLRDIGAAQREPELAGRSPTFLGYPQHVAALETVMDLLDNRGLQVPAVVASLVQAGTGRAAIEKLADHLVQPGTDIVNAGSVRTRIVAEFDQLSRGLREFNRDYTAPRTDAAGRTALAAAFNKSGAATAERLFTSADNASWRSVRDHAAALERQRRFASHGPASARAAQPAGMGLG